MTKKKLLLIDGSSLAFRAFFSILNLESFKNQNGLHTNALFSFHRMFENIMNAEQPTHVLVAFDAGKTTFRNEWFGEYKGGRQKTPSEFREQMPYFNVLLDAFGVSHYRLNHYEADDIIGTLAAQADKDQFEVVVLSGDKDLIQLAAEGVRVEITAKGVSELVTYTPETIMEKYGLTPEQIIDMKGLMGDSSDNYPGVTKVGEKTAVKLLQQYHSIEGIYEQIDEMKASKLKENLIADRKQAFLSKRLARIHTQAPLEITIDDVIYRGKDHQALLHFYKEMNFQSFQTELLGTTPEVAVDESYDLNVTTIDDVSVIDETYFKTATTLHLETIEENYHVAEIVAVAWGNAEHVYVAKGDVVKTAAFKNWLEDETIEKTVFDSKATTVLLRKYGIRPHQLRYDISLLAYLLDTNDAIKEVATVASKQGFHMIALDEVVYGKGAKRGVPEDFTRIAQHVGAKVHVLAQIGEKMIEDLVQHGQQDLYEKIELPLANVLAEMEIQGIYVDADRLVEMGQAFEVRLAEIEQLIYTEAGETFNINSTKQLGVILFEKMGLPAWKKTKTGYSTAVDVLEKLAAKAPIVAYILEYRQLAKLKSTYIEGLLGFTQSDQKIHTRYVQTLTQTGRLSSTDPNLQNIPIRTEEGRKIRYAFLPSQSDWVILASDYSQIELRILAHISQDKHMQQAFKQGEDIHTSTAMRVFGLKNASEVTNDMRRQAKAVNFGIVYGISDYGLSQNLNITRQEAKEFIDRYFEEFPNVQNYMQDIVEKGRQEGFVETLFHRRRYLPDLHASNFNVRSFAERTAMNSPIQGSAADILKVAMINIYHQLQERQLKTRMLLQVHDELIFEVPTQELEEVKILVEEVMEQAVALDVPLQVDTNYGPSWYEAK